MNYLYIYKMENPIVKHYYSVSEKLGLKKHKAPQEEIDFLENLSPDDQFQAFFEENRFNKRRVNIKRSIINIICLLVILSTIVLFLESYFLWAGLSFILIGALLIISKRYQNRREIYNYELAYLRTMRRMLLEKSFQ